MQEKKNTTARDIFIILGVIVMLFFVCPKMCSNTGSKSESSNKEPVISQVQIQAFENVINKGYVRIENNYRVYIDPIFWAVCDAQQKQSIAYGAAAYCAHKRGDRSLIVDIYDKQSGKKIATYDAFGLKVF